MDRLHEALNNLNKVQKKIQYEFAQLDGPTVDEFLGDHNSASLRDQLREYGDGYACHSIPKSIAELEAINAIVLMAVTFPKLDDDSDFDPTTPLHTIPYWRDNMKLRTVAESEGSGRKYRLHFLSWQQEVSVHGVDIDQARNNRRLLISKLPQIERLMETEKKCASEFVLCCSDWCKHNERAFVVVTHFARRTFPEPVGQLVVDPDTLRVCASLRRRNYEIMPGIESILP